MLHPVKKCTSGKSRYGCVYTYVYILMVMMYSIITLTWAICVRNIYGGNSSKFWTIGPYVEVKHLYIFCGVCSIQLHIILGSNELESESNLARLVWSSSNQFWWARDRGYVCFTSPIHFIIFVSKISVKFFNSFSKSI